MASSPFSIHLDAPTPRQLPDDELLVSLGGEPQSYSDDGAQITNLDGGDLLVDFSGRGYVRDDVPEDFNANLAEYMDESELNGIATDLLEGIQNDYQSSAEWRSTYASGIPLLGLTIEPNRSGPGSGAAFEGMSTERHPLLQESCLQFSAVACGEMLPASGPVKVRDDQPPKPDAPPMPPPAPMMGHNGGPPLDEPTQGSNGASPFSTAMPQNGGSMAGPGPQPPHPGSGMAVPFPPMQGMGIPVPPQDRDALAAALEKDLNHFLTTTAQEYYPDTRRMLYLTGFGGTGIKKVYNCPLRRRPVSESVPIESFIVSNALTDLGNASRITHEIKMRQSTVRRMQILGVYLDVPLGQPPLGDNQNEVTAVKAETIGVTVTPTNPKDADYTIEECYCELEIDRFAPEHFKGKGLPLPYKVSIEKDSQKILEIRRNWREDDPECTAREFFVEYYYQKAFGFYGMGLLHILGNTTKTLTAAWRELIDSGMFANFPAFIYNKGVGRQLTNQFRAGPGQGIPVDAGLGKLSDNIMSLPYKDLGPMFVQFIMHVEELGQRLGGAANITVGEGRQDAPVGTTLALIEQATKPTGAVLKGLHSSQSKELQLLKDRFKDDPEAFWRFNKKPTMPWQKEQFLQALENFDLVPVSDPNNPTKMHRMAKSAFLQQVAVGIPGLLDPKKVFKRISRDMEISDADDLIMPPMPPQPPPVDAGKMAAAQAKMEGDKLRSQTELTKAQMTMQNDAAERENRMAIEELKVEVARLTLAASIAKSAEEAETATRHLEAKLVSDQHKDARGHRVSERQADADRILEREAMRVAAKRAKEKK